MTQYHSIKDRYPDTILFYRMGDFYEMFQEDAVKAAAILEIALTSRNKNSSDSIPMCGVPHRAADAYIAKLIENGCKVAVCEQVEDAATAKGLVKREVVRVITPGMILSEELLDKTSNNFLLALCITGNRAGLSCLDISTGQFRVTEAETVNGRVPPILIDEALRVDAGEVLLPAIFKKDPVFKYLVKVFPKTQISYLDRIAFRREEAGQILREKFKTRSLEGFGCDHFDAGICAAGAILSYVATTQLQDTDHILGIEPYTLENYLNIDDRSCKNLELLKNIQTQDKKGTLLGVLDKTVTAMGGRLLKQWLRYPLMDKTSIKKRLDGVSEILKNPLVRENIRSLLKGIYDLERLGSRISMGHGNAKDLTALKSSLLNLPDLFAQLSTLNSPALIPDTLMLKTLDTDIIEELQSLAALIDSAIREDAPHLLGEGRLIRDGYSRELDELLDIARDGRSWMAKAGVEEKKKTGISSLKIKYNKVFGYFIEVSRAQSALVPDNYIRKQTLVNAERFITDELKEVEAKVLGAQDKRSTLEYRLFCEIRDRVNEKTPQILKTASFLASVDVLVSLAQAADENQYVMPSITEDGRISIQDGRHPVVEKMISGERYVPNSVELDQEHNQVILITGPNMAGKSTVLRQVALTVLMAQMGSFVPASRASICITDRIFTRVGALDNLSQGQSTFMVEMEETANIINNAGEKSLVILDEIGRGTSTFDGMSIAWAVAEYLHDLDDKGVKTLFATHYHELTRLEELKPRVKNFNIAVKEFNDNIIFLRQLVRGGTNKSYGIQVARLAGVPNQVVAKAKEILSTIETRGVPQDSISSPPTPPRVAESPGQMDLFGPQEMEQIIAAIDKVEISSITPLEAMNLLDKLKQQIKNLISKPC